MLSRASSLVYGRARRLTDQAAQRAGEHVRQGSDLVLALGPLMGEGKHRIEATVGTAQRVRLSQVVELRNRPRQSGRTATKQRAEHFHLPAGCSRGNTISSLEAWVLVGALRCAIAGRLSPASGAEAIKGVEHFVNSSTCFRRRLYVMPFPGCDQPWPLL